MVLAILCPLEPPPHKKNECGLGLYLRLMFNGLTLCQEQVVVSGVLPPPSRD